MTMASIRAYSCFNVATSFKVVGTRMRLENGLTYASFNVATSFKVVGTQ